jgi:hypothetical protein
MDRSNCNSSSVRYCSSDQPPAHGTRQPAVCWILQSAAAPIVQREQEGGGAGCLTSKLRELSAELDGETRGDGHAEADGAASVAEQDYSAVRSVIGRSPGGVVDEGLCLIAVSKLQRWGSKQHAARRSHLSTSLLRAFGEGGAPRPFQRVR